MADTNPPLIALVHRLEASHALDESDIAAVLALPYVRRTFEAAAYIVREGEPPRKTCSFVVSGYAFRQKLTAQGSRQIISIELPGDLLDLQHLFLDTADHNVQALTRLETVEVDREALRSLALRHPAIGEAIWTLALITASIFREWMTNIGRRDARSRIAHLLCEFATRMDANGLSDGNKYELPMTQEQIGDATGLTSVHVNRMLRSMEVDGLVYRDKRYLSFVDWDRIRDAADFSALYLHLDQGGGASGKTDSGKAAPEAGRRR